MSKLLGATPRQIPLCLQHRVCGARGASYGGSALLGLALLGCKSPPAGEDQDTQGSESNQSETDPGTEETTQKSESESESGEPDPTSYADPGEYKVGNLAMELADLGGDRNLRVELWYPASGVAAGAGQALADFELAEADAATLAALVDVAPAECVRKQPSSCAATMSCG